MPNTGYLLPNLPPSNRTFYEHIAHSTWFKQAFEIAMIEPSGFSVRDPLTKRYPGICRYALSLAGSVACWNYWRCKIDHKFDPESTTLVGHGFGELAALVCAGVLSLDDALRFTRELLQIVEPAPKCDILITDCDQDTLCEICESVTNTNTAAFVSIVNAKNRTVCSVMERAVDRVKQYLSARGNQVHVIASNAIPFHTPLLEPFTNNIEILLDSFPLQHAQYPILSSAVGGIAQSERIVKKSLVNQLTNVIDWQDAMERLSEIKLDVVLDSSSGGVLSQIPNSIKKMPVIRLDLPADKLQAKFSELLVAV